MPTFDTLAHLTIWTRRVLIFIAGPMAFALGSPTWGKATIMIGFLIEPTVMVAYATTMHRPKTA